MGRQVEYWVNAPDGVGKQLGLQRAASPAVVATSSGKTRLEPELLEIVDVSMFMERSKDDVGRQSW